MKSLVRVLSPLVFLMVFGSVSCSEDAESSDSGNEPNRPDDTGAACELAIDCYPDVPESELQGEAVCITSVRDGYCTHTCETDDDCCAADGECAAALVEVCSPFESMDGLHCFVSCESEDVAQASGVSDEQDYCQKKASPDFICRSSGGGSTNRKICVPGDCGVGARCDGPDDCDADLECVTSLDGGYCTRGCLGHAECPGGSLCVGTPGEEGYCYRSCTQASDCSFCRSTDTPATCSDDVTFAETGMTGSVCVPG